ncbi:MAG TPA: hypothetical protein VFV15_03420, partial [Moraxellaceae bacterium]|nr:hypothetical protein [Moraxellaceae bacterium]
MQIENRYLQWIKGDSVAMLAREGMIGDSFISVSSGNPALPALVPEDRLRFVAGSSLGDIAMDVRNRVVPVIEELHTFLRYTNDPKGDIRAAFRELLALTRDLQQTNREAAAALASLDRLAKEDTPATLAAARGALARAEASLAELEKAVPALSAQATRSLAALDQATAAAAGSAERASALLDATRPRLEGTLSEAELLMRDSRAAINAARTRWPFRGPDVAPAVVAPPAAASPVGGAAATLAPAAGAEAAGGPR